MIRFLLCLLLLPTSLPLQAKDNLSNELALAERWLEAQRAYDQVPGMSAAIVDDQDLLWSGGSGFADLASEQPARDDTIYGICSISKLFTGIAVMQLRDQGKFQLDDRVSGLLPWFNLIQAFPGSPEITLRALLTHSSGLPREADMHYWMGPDFIFPTQAQLRELLGGQTTIYPADRYYQYSNLALSLAGDIVAEQSGQDYARYVEEHILQPLQLKDTTTDFPTDQREARVATGYGYSGRDGALPPLPRYHANAITPAAGFASTALDLARFASWQFRVLNGQSDSVLAANTLREMQRVQWMDWDWSVARGLAFGVYRVGGRTLTGHAGSCPGFSTRLFLDPLSHYAVITMANRNRVDVDGYASTLLDILEADGAPTETAGATETDLPDLEPYLGNYDARPWDGEDMVFRWKDGLAMVSLPTMTPITGMVRLMHDEGDRFHTIRSDEQPGHEVMFQRDATGKVTHLVYHALALPKMDESDLD